MSINIQEKESEISSLKAQVRSLQQGDQHDDSALMDEKSQFIAELQEEVARQ